MKTIVVVGAGVTGLSAMFHLQKWQKQNNADLRLVLVESSAQVGGKIKTVHEQGFIMEAGADSIVTRKIQGMNLIDDLNLKEHVVYNSTGQSFIYGDGQLAQIPKDSVFGIPASIESLANSPLISAEGKVAALKDLYTENQTFTKDDSIGDFLEYFLGTEILEKQIAPVLSGVYSGKLSELSIGATLPFILEYKNEYGSLIRGLEVNKAKFQSNEGKKFISFENGLQTLTDQYAQQLNSVELYTNYEVTAIDKIEDHYQIAFANEEVMEADIVVLAVPHARAQKMLKNENLDQDFSRFTNSSLISVYLGFDLPDSLLPESGTGFIAANNEELSCNACTWTSRKWEHTSKEGNLLVRLFYKESHPSFASIKNMEEDALIQVALQDIEKSLGIQAKPVTTLITNWSNNMPKYQIDHQQTVNNLESKLATMYPRLFLAGSSYYGVGISDCIKNGIETAKRIIQTIEEK